MSSLDQSAESLFRWQRALFALQHEQVEPSTAHVSAARSADAARSMVEQATHSQLLHHELGERNDPEALAHLVQLGHALAVYAHTMDRGLAPSLAAAAHHNSDGLGQAVSTLTLAEVQAMSGLVFTPPALSLFHTSIPQAPAMSLNSTSSSVARGGSTIQTNGAPRPAAPPMQTARSRFATAAIPPPAVAASNTATTASAPSWPGSGAATSSTAPRQRQPSADTFERRPFNREPIELPDDKVDMDTEPMNVAPSEFVTARDQLIINQQLRRGGGNASGPAYGGRGQGGQGRGGVSAFGRGRGRGRYDEPDNSFDAPPGSSNAHSNLMKEIGSSVPNYNLGATPQTNNANQGARKALGTRRTPGTKFVPPFPRSGEGGQLSRPPSGGPTSAMEDDPIMQDERLRNIEPKMVELIMNEIMDHGAPIDWDDIAGLEFAKATVKEMVVWPMLRPDLFHGLLGPPKGLLLFGPPGTGKTLIGKCIAVKSKATFFSISSSSLTSKWVGEGEKMVRALFAVARVHQPSVIFIDEIDSLLTQRSDGEHEASRRIKTEFLVQLDGATSGSDDDRLLVVGATNRPQEIDEAARRRLVKKLYIPLPDAPARRQIVLNLLGRQGHALSGDEIELVVSRSQGYSGADMSHLCKEAALGPIRCISDLSSISADQVRPIQYVDFDKAFRQVRASVSQKDLEGYIKWNTQFGSSGIGEQDESTLSRD